MLVKLFSVSVLCSVAFASPISFKNGAYDGIVFGISDRVPAMDCKNILNNLEVSEKKIIMKLSFEFFRNNWRRSCITKIDKYLIDIWLETVSSKKKKIGNKYLPYLFLVDLSCKTSNYVGTYFGLLVNVSKPKLWTT